MEKFEFRLKFRWNMFLRVQLIIRPPFVRAVVWRQAITWTIVDQPIDAYMRHQT